MDNDDLQLYKLFRIQKYEKFYVPTDAIKHISIA